MAEWIWFSIVAISSTFAMCWIALALVDFMYFLNRSGFKFLGLATVAASISWFAGYHLVNL